LQFVIHFRDLPGIKDWLNASIPGNGVVFVTPPEMTNQDEPTPESLPLFEKDLAAAIHTAETAQHADPTAVSAVSWDSLCKSIMSVFSARLYPKSNEHYHGQ